MAKTIEQIIAEKEHFMSQVAKLRKPKPQVIIINDEQYAKLKKGKFRLTKGTRYRLAGKEKIHIVK